MTTISRSHPSGVVYLVGAGPGDPELITVRGRDLIMRADVVVYDYLASKHLLTWARKDAELIYVGKQAGCHSLPQEHINQLLVDKAGQGQNVVRLKGGDPYVFGRGGEEAQALAQAGIRFEVVPGVTAAVAAAAYAGIPVTHRDVASAFALITGHEDADRIDGSQIDWAALGQWRGTLAFYMGVKNLPLICSRLREHGMAADTPVALIQSGTTPQQKTVVGTLATIVDWAQKHDIRPPTIIIIGRVVGLRDPLRWFEHRPLFGKRVVVTRSRAQMSEVAWRLHQLGAEVLECPTIKILPPEDGRPLREAMERWEHYDWLILTSVNGVDTLFEQLRSAGYDARRLARVKVCVIGPATAERLEKQGIVADVIPPRFVAESIVDALAEATEISGKRFLLARADIARSDLARLLREQGAMVDDVEAYRTVADEGSKAEILASLEKDQVDWITFSSSSTVQNFFAQVDQRLLTGKKVRLASIGPLTSAAIRDLGLNVDVEAEEYTFEGLIGALCRNENPT